MKATPVTAKRPMGVVKSVTVLSLGHGPEAFDTIVDRTLRAGHAHGGSCGLGVDGNLVEVEDVK